MFDVSESDRRGIGSCVLVNLVCLILFAYVNKQKEFFINAILNNETCLCQWVVV